MLVPLPFPIEVAGTNVTPEGQRVLRDTLTADSPLLGRHLYVIAIDGTGSGESVCVTMTRRNAGRQ